ncbi:S-layer homology domain-containing protein [Paenibacillus mucilaginosus]|uniref:S-layer domain-containing protein n=1 Tax=Paenibacillus mucilaginosus (strain KNP414) TaxID=1036673 RepID=F8FCY0_PAEMK|nr:S-layer homology domain-containing protein [Paenibacillus mucilaginosus]AEI41397.1 S-layer domain-containing protein [Paenibacillus mucilaginosus KNP414]MCG7211185.1 S-layer homology domain-containing protein [Paenibacillus mucilaginosus]WDM30419.1 S-layer homology domain-containing protein [Paenibacillus mucilaginosus]
MSKKHNQARRLAAAVLALTLAVGSPAYAAETSAEGSSAAAADTASQRFSDVSAEHWAIKHITKLSALGIIEGYERREYRPENSVTQQEVVVMALRMMGLESEVQKNKAETVLPVAVSDYAKPYIAYAFDKGLILPSEEVEATPAKATWGTKEATREWVAKLVIRAIGKEQLAEDLEGESSSFTDAEDNSEWAGGYINAAVSLKIVQGFEDGGFKPQGKVTRAQMATFLSRADKEMVSRPKNIVTGYVLELTDRKLKLLNANEETVEYTVSSDTVVYNAKDDSRIALSNIKLTNEVYLVVKGNAVSYMELTNEEQKLETFEGTLSKLYLDQMMVSLQQGNQDTLYKLAENVAVTDSEGRGLSLSSVVPGTIVELKRNTLLKEENISLIVVKQLPISKTAEGTILSIEADKGTISFQENASGLPENYGISLQTSVKTADGAASDITKLRVGDNVTYEIKDNALMNITIRKQADYGQSVQATMTSLNEDKTILTVSKSGEGLGAYYIADNVAVTIDGLQNASLYDLESGDELKLELLNDKVVGITVTSRSIKQYIYASIIGYDADTKALMINSEAGVGAFKLTENTSIRYQGSKIDLSQFQTVFIGSSTSSNSRKSRVDLKVSKDKVVSIENTQYVDGTITQLTNNSNIANDLTIRTAAGQNLTFKVNNGTPVEVEGKTTATLGDLKVGDLVRVTPTFAQDYVTKISSLKSGVYKVLLTNATSREVQGKDASGKTVKFTIENDDKIYNPGQASHTFSQIGIDEYITATIVGTKVDSVTIQNAQRGKVTGVDAAAGTVTLQAFGGAVQVVNVGTGASVKQGAAVIGTLGSVKPNDRVEIRKDESGKYVIELASVSKRTVSGYDSVLKQMVFKAGTNNEKTNYNLFTKAYLHKGSETVAAGSFKADEEVNVYVIDDKIFELEK